MTRYDLCKYCLHQVDQTQLAAEVPDRIICRDLHFAPRVSGVSAGLAPDRVAVGRYQPTAPTDPYVRTLAHTVPQFMASLRA